MTRLLALAMLLVAGCPSGGHATGDASVSFDGGDPGPDLDGGGGAGAYALVYVSGYTQQIAVYRLDLASGRLLDRVATPVPGSPSFLATDPARRHLYAVNERTPGQVRSFAITGDGGALTAVNLVSSGGNGPAHLSVDRSARWVLAANYGDGTVAALPARSDGTLGAPRAAVNAGKNAHQIVTNPANTRAYVPCLGSDFIAVYDFDATSGQLTPSAVATIALPPRSGPRHLAWHPNGRFAYLIRETDSKVTAYAVGASGDFSELQTVSTLPAGFSGSNTGAEVVVHPSGRFLYGSNRGDDSIVTYQLDGNGRLTLAGHRPSGGHGPRSFAVDAGGRFLLVANQGSNNVEVFTIDAQSGLPSDTHQSVPFTQPAFVGIVAPPR